MVQTPAMLAEGALMHLTARYQIVAGDFAAFDQASDALLDALYDAGLEDVDVAVSMTEPALEVWFTVATDDAMHALAVAARVLEEAFAKAGLAAVGFKVAAQPNGAPVLGPADLHAEAVPA